MNQVVIFVPRAPEGNDSAVGNRCLIAIPALLVILATLILLGAPHTAKAQTYDVLYAFCSQANCADGGYPNANLLLDAGGNLYGTTVEGGVEGDCKTAGCGSVFKISQIGTETVLYPFDVFANGLNPMGGLIRDQAGNLYGTTSEGGNFLGHSLCHDHGCGTIFELSPAGAETVLFAFFDIDLHHQANYNGIHPFGDLAMDAKGNLYGTGSTIGPKYAGSVFELTPTGDESVLHWFHSYTHDGKYVNAGLVLDSAGNLYGTTQAGGVHQGGTVFEIDAAGTESVLYSFGKAKKYAANGYDLGASVMRDAQGNFYGTTLLGGKYNHGVVYKLSSTGVETVLHDFAGQPDGAAALGTPIMDAQGNLYGTTANGGVYDKGAVYKLTPAGEVTILYSFTGGADGSGPQGPLTMGGDGSLYGTTQGGGNTGSACPFGSAGCGVAFKVTQ